MNQKKRVVWIDSELVWDYWSLMFCCLRIDQPTFTNNDYTKVFYKAPSTFLSPKSLELYQSHLVSVKPWYPGYDFYNYLQSLENIEVKLVDSANVLNQKQLIVPDEQDYKPDLFITANECFEGEHVLKVRARNLSAF